MDPSPAVDSACPPRLSVSPSVMTAGHLDPDFPGDFLLYFVYEPRPVNDFNPGRVYSIVFLVQFRHKGSPFVSCKRPGGSDPIPFSVRSLGLSLSFQKWRKQTRRYCAFFEKRVTCVFHAASPGSTYLRGQRA
eukprot:2146745-Prymnesium_polylepis.1